MPQFESKPWVAVAQSSLTVTRYSTRARKKARAMARVCTICRHPQREAIDRALIAGEPYRSIAQQFAASADAVLRHKKEHLPEHLSKAQEAAEMAQAGDLLGQMASLQATTLRILTSAEGAGDSKLMLSAIKEVRANTELLAKLTHQLSDRPTVNVLVMPEWMALQATLMEALRPYPQARVAVAERLAALEAGPSGERGIQ